MKPRLDRVSRLTISLQSFARIAHFLCDHSSVVYARDAFKVEARVKLGAWGRFSCLNI
jgi:hypothetical protein